MVANKPMRSIRGTDNVNELEKPKEKGNKPNKPMWQEGQPAGPWD